MPQPEAAPKLDGSFRLFRVAGISVYVHWSWLVVAYFEIQYRTNLYTTQVWNIAEYLTLFAIVLVHEFGHALACRQVGGEARQIVLWPLGGIAFVSPPPRPGAVLWSIAAGPLVNVALVPVTLGVYILASLPGWREVLSPDAHLYLLAITVINLSLLVFNMLPIYPLDGGQILQALLWFFVGRARSLLIVSIIGMVAAAGALVWAAVERELWIGVLAVFVAFRSLAGFQQARLLARWLEGPKQEGAACPACQAAPPSGAFWTCAHCQGNFDFFANRAICPTCGAEFSKTACASCGQASPIASWYTR